MVYRKQCGLGKRNAVIVPYLLSDSWKEKKKQRSAVSYRVFQSSLTSLLNCLLQNHWLALLKQILSKLSFYSHIRSNSDSIEIHVSYIFQRYLQFCVAIVQISTQDLVYCGSFAHAAEFLS